MKAVVEPMVSAVGPIVSVVAPPLEHMEPGPKGVQRVVDEVASVVTVRPAPAHAMIQVSSYASSVMSVTSRAPRVVGASMVPYHVYAELGRDPEFLLGQVSVIREVVDSMIQTLARRTGMSGSETESRVCAIEEITRHRFTEVPSTSDSDVESRMATSLVCWVLPELPAILIRVAS